MSTLHVVQAGVENGDRAWIELAARDGLSTPSWVVPKSVTPGDAIVIYVAGFGFFATGRITSQPKPSRDWVNRYVAGVDSIRLIEPAISITAIQRHIPELTWARYPRGITTPATDVANKIQKVIAERRKGGVLDLDDEALDSANIDELRRVALLKAHPSETKAQQKIIYRARSRAIRLYVLRRANGRCEGCDSPAPFRRIDGTPYLEPHHTTRLADDGPDHPAHVIAVCPNCHRRAHHSDDSAMFNRRLKRLLAKLERE
jgi:hypothetical protein